jgi:hypothetical protein
VETIEAVVENGQIRLPEELRLPDRTKVYVVIPARAGEPTRTYRIMSPRLANPEHARDFVKEMTPEN